MRTIDADILKVVLEKNFGHTGGASVLEQLIDEQPTVQPNLQPTCNQLATDTISRKAAIDALGERPIVWTDDDQYTLGERNQYDIDRLAIETLPSAERVGKWVKAEKGGEWWYACSMCEGHIPKTLWGQDWHSSYCPNCGARMEPDQKMD